MAKKTAATPGIASFDRIVATLVGLDKTVDAFPPNLKERLARLLRVQHARLQATSDLVEMQAIVKTTDKHFRKR